MLQNLISLNSVPANIYALGYFSQGYPLAIGYCRRCLLVILADPAGWLQTFFFYTQYLIANLNYSRK